MQVPVVTNVTVVPETVQIDVVAEVNATANELDDVAETVKVSVPAVLVLFPNALNVMVWLACEIVIVKLEVVAVVLFASVTLTVMAKLPVAVGVPEIVPVDEFKVTPPGRDPLARANELEPAPPLVEIESE